MFLGFRWSYEDDFGGETKQKGLKSSSVILFSQAQILLFIKKGKKWRKK